MAIVEHSEQPVVSTEAFEQRLPEQLPVKEKRRRLKRSLKLLPNLFTLGNAFFGFCALIFAANKNPYAASYCILLGASMDALDGRIARLTHSTSPLGMELDSLADAISFCLAPAFMMYMWDFNVGNILGFIGSSFYFLAGLFRLARFNVTSQTQTSYFLGLPTTIAGCCIATISLIFPLKEHEFLASLLLITLGYLMVSRLRFPTFKQASKRGIFTTLMVVGVVTATLGFNKTFFFLGVGYFILSLVSTLRLRAPRSTPRS